MKCLTLTELLNRIDIGYCQSLATLGALSESAVYFLLQQSTIKQFDKGDTRDGTDQLLDRFYVVLTGDIAFYRHCDGHDVLTRHYLPGEQMAFDVMIGLRTYSGIEVATETSIILEISSDKFFQFHVDYPTDFGVLMINLARELSREIAMLEDGMGQSTGWKAIDN